MERFRFLWNGHVSVPKWYPKVLLYLASLVLVALAIGIRFLLHPWLGGSMPFVTYFLLALPLLYFEDWKPAAFALFLGAVGLTWFFVEPRIGYSWTSACTWLGPAVYLLAGFCVVGLVQSLARARRLAQGYAQEAHAQKAEFQRLVAELEQTGKALRESQENERARRAELEAIMEITPAAILIAHDPECRNITGNRMAYEHAKQPLGANLSPRASPMWAERKKVVIRKSGQAVGPDELPMERATRTGRPVLQEELELEDGHGRRWVYGNAVPLLDAAGSVRGALGAFIDITERKQHEEILLQSERLLRLFVAHAPSAIAMFDKQMRYLAVSDRWLSDYRINRDIIGLSHYEVFPEIPERWKQVHQRVLAGAVERTEEDCFPRADGSVTWLKWEVRPWHDSSGEICGLIMLTEDITARKVAEEARRKVEARFRAIFEGTAVGIALLNQESRFVETNPKFQALLGYSAKELQGRTVAAVSHPEDRELDRFSCENLARKGEPYQVDRRFVRKNGDVLWGRVTASILPQEPAEKSLLIGVVVDITESKKFEESLRRSEERFRTMAETLPDIIFTSTADGCNDYCNHSFYEYTGLPSGAAIGNRWMEFLHPDDRERARSAWSASVRSGKPIEIQHRLRSRAGEYRWFLVRARPIKDDRGGVVQWFGVATDIDDQKRAEEKLERRVAERTAKLQETIGELEHYSYSITHDLRAPLRAMHGFARILERDWPGEPAVMRDYLERIIISSKRMDRLLKDTLNYGKVLREELKLEPVDVGPLLHGMVQSYINLQLPRAEIRIERSFPLVLGNQAALTHCLSNLLDNAVKFVSPGTLPQVRVWAESRGDWVRLWVQDNGIGIPKDVQDQIFGMFQRLDRGFEGTGIGLAIVRKAMERMGGKAGVESEPGQGSRFWLDLKAVKQGLGDKDAQLCHSVCGG